ncbi:MAG TPA: glycoside hydrolase family 127 protein [Aggregatilineales bacterium]|nr:glycoside hydrolase family 127 protein [Aggregatilineales bacterium]
MEPDPHGTPRPVDLRHVQITGGLWHERQAVNRASTIPAIYDQLERTGRIDAWRMDPNRERPKRRTVITMFFDSDTAKWLEAAAYELRTQPDAQLEAQVDQVIDLIEAAQQPDGYLNTYFPIFEPENRWRNLRDYHEMYNAGHLIEAAVAYYEATGKRKFLDVMCRYADLIATLFGPNEGQKRGYPGHPELELALVKLYQATSEARYLNLARYFIDERGQSPHYFDLEAAERGEDPEDFWAKTYRYCQAHVPLREQTEATGHAVRACYLYAGVADIARETGDAELLDLSRRLWDNLTSHQMYITGGLGPAHSNEGFTFAFDLPNETAYAETCAGIALAFWAHRMFHIDPDARYIDVMERALYNNVLSGVSHSGDHFFYANPLASYPYVNPQEHLSGITTDAHYQRKPWYFCPCCPPNLARIVASIGQYMLSTAPGRIYVHLYNASTAAVALDGQTVRLEQQTRYPWDGTVEMRVGCERPAAFALALRIPGWCRAHRVEVNGEPVSGRLERGYLHLERAWHDGDRVTLTLEMPVERMTPHPMIRHDAGQVALQRGPIVYCLEQVDNGPRLANVTLPPDAPLTTAFDENLLGGAAVIYGMAQRVEPGDWPGGLYQPGGAADLQRTPFAFRAIPYYLWANRDPGEMRVWIREG